MVFHNKSVSTPLSLWFTLLSEHFQTEETMDSVTTMNIFLLEIAINDAQAFEYNI